MEIMVEMSGIIFVLVGAGSDERHEPRWHRIGRDSILIHRLLIVMRKELATDLRNLSHRTRRLETRRLTLLISKIGHAVARSK